MRTITILALVAFATANFAAAEHPLHFDVKWLAVDANEGCAVADFDDDGKLDVVAGRNWFRNGDWLPRPVRNIKDVNGYVHSNGDFAMDVNGDGNVDVVAGDFFDTKVFWYENPGREQLLQGMQWPAHLLADTAKGSNEFTMMHDIDGDRQREWISNSWNARNPLIIWRFVKDAGEDKEAAAVKLMPHVVGQNQNGHGMGFGDLNNDGRKDILVGTGWYERPAGDPFAGEWKFRDDWNRSLSCPVLVRDIDGDGHNDVIWGNPHDFGLFVWYGQGVDSNGKWQYRERQIDDSFSQLHCIQLADLDGDGRDELITGKRVRAHNGNDPGGREPPLVCYYTIDKAGDFTRHDIVRDQVGIGLQIRTADINGDDRLDIILAGKDGTQILFQRK